MFGIIASGRPVETNIQQVDEFKYVFVLSKASQINYISIFMLPGAELPANLAASVYFQSPGKDFILLGVLSQTKQSAIFRINNKAAANKGSLSNFGDMDDSMMDDDDSDYDITIGISIEDASIAEQALAAKKAAQNQAGPPLALPASSNASTVASATSPQATVELANKIIQNAYNFLSGFTRPDGSVPMRAFDDWWNKFKTKIASNPKYLDTIN